MAIPTLLTFIYLLPIEKKAPKLKPLGKWQMDLPVRRRRGCGFTQSGSHQIILGFVQRGHLFSQTCQRSVGPVPHVAVGAPRQPFFLVPFRGSAAVCTAEQ